MKKIIFLLTIFLNIPVQTFASVVNENNSLKFINIQQTDKTNFKRFNIISKDISKDTKISGNIMYIDNFSKKYVQSAINQTIEDVYTLRLTQHLNNADSINFSTNYKEYKDLSSIILYTEIIRQDEIINYADTFNFNNKTGESLNIYSIFDENSISLLISEINKKINELYGFNNIIIKNDQSFYVENGNIFILFDTENPNFPSNEITSIKIEVDHTSKYKINENETLNKNGITMIPLRNAMDRLNYKLLWNDEKHSVKLTAGNNNIYFAVEENKYIINNKYRELELPPQIINNILYVPLSFFELILEGYYYFDENKNFVIVIFN